MRVEATAIEVGGVSRARVGTARRWPGVPSCHARARHAATAHRGPRPIVPMPCQPDSQLYQVVALLKLFFHQVNLQRTLVSNTLEIGYKGEFS